jgi:hypothetical protein
MITLRECLRALSPATKNAILFDSPIGGGLTDAVKTMIETDLKTALPPITPAEIQAIIALIVQLLPVILALFGGG